VTIRYIDIARPATAATRWYTLVLLTAMTIKTAIYIALGVLTAIFVAIWFVEARRRPIPPVKPTARDISLGLVTNFLDALGIGCFATISACYKFWHMVPDEMIPGTMNVGVALAAVAEAYIFLAFIEVEPLTLGGLIAAAALGAWLGAGIVARWPRRKIQLGMGAVLLVTAAFGIVRQLGMLPGGGDLLGLSGLKLAIAAALIFVLGALTTLGIGFFAPCMMLIFLLGMNAKTAFPIMMGSMAFVGPVAGIQFVRGARYQLGPALGLTFGGIPGVLIAAYLVKEIPLGLLRWIVIAIVTCTAILMLRSAAKERASAQ
jgi:uncharacterized membrane protein YfcA